MRCAAPRTWTTGSTPRRRGRSSRSTWRCRRALRPRRAVLARAGAAFPPAKVGAMRILILGGDGYLGWPTAMRFSARGHEVFLVDNFSRRRWHNEHSTDSLTPISSLADRIDAWNDITGNE